MKIGVIGTGKFGLNHIRAYSELCEDVFIYDKEKVLAEKAAALVNKPNIRTAETLDDLLNSVDTVSVVVPTDLHYTIAKTCLEAGKHVFVEKPFTTNTKEALDLIELSDAKNLRLGVGHTFRFSDTVKELEYNFRLRHRDVRYMILRFLQPNPPRTDSDIVFNLGTHLIDTIYFITKQDPTSVLSKYNDSYGSIILTYAGGPSLPPFIANLELANYYPEKVRDILIVGRNNTKRYDISQSKKEPLKEQLEHFLQCIRKSDPVTSAHDAYFDVRLCELIQESNKTGREVDVTYDL